MNKNFTLIALVLLAIFQSQAQTIVWQDDFENAANWNLNVANGNTGIFLTTSGIAAANNLDETYLYSYGLDHSPYTSNSFTITSTNSVKLLVQTSVILIITNSPVFT